MKPIKQYLPWLIRIATFVLFMLSAISKMFPLWQFEKLLVDIGAVDWCYAHYLARFIIACELALGVAILQCHFLKRFVIPIIIFLLIIFCVYLSIQMYKYGVAKGDCGCFGQLITMTPFEAFIKNIITIAMLIYLYFNVKEQPKGENKFIYLAFIGVLALLIMFMCFPFAPCKKQPDRLPYFDATNQEKIISPAEDSISKSEEPEITVNNEDTTDLERRHNTPKDKTTENDAKIVNRDSARTGKTEKALPQVNSRFTSYTIFGKKRVNLNKGKKIVCLFSAGCDHCQDVAKEIGALSQKKNFPEVYILFMDEETDIIPDFFAKANCLFPYQIINIPAFWELFGKDGNTPGVFYLNNGNIIKSFEGTDANKFNADELIKAIQIN